MIAENLNGLQIHKLTQEQYDTALAAGELDDNVLYLTEEDDDDDDSSGVSLENVTGVLPVENGGTGVAGFSKIQPLTIDSTTEKKVGSYDYYNAGITIKKGTYLVAFTGMNNSIEINLGGETLSLSCNSTYGETVFGFVTAPNDIVLSADESSGYVRRYYNVNGTFANRFIMIPIYPYTF